MPVLLLLQHGDPATMNALEKTALARLWKVHRYPQVPAPQALLQEQELVLFGGASFVLNMARALHLGLIGPGNDWLSRLPAPYRTEAEPATFVRQFRCFVHEGRIETMSLFHRQGAESDTANKWQTTHQEQREAVSFAVRVLLDPEVAQPPAFALDIGLVEGKGWAVRAAQPCYNASMYGCDPEQVLSVLSRACRARARLSRADLPWVAP
jgi:hypothetical protein